MISDTHQGRGDRNVTPAFIVELKDLITEFASLGADSWVIDDLEALLDTHGY